MLNKSHLSKPADDSDAIHDDVSGEINAITAKTAPADADIFLIEDSAASWIKKKLSWSGIKATLLAYFNGVYARKGTNADITSMSALTQITRATGGAFDIAIGGASGDDFTVDTNKLVVEGDSGNVGVNTPIPGAKLEVYNGNVYITSMTGDPELRFRTMGVPNPVTKFSLGVDESDGNKFKIGRGTITTETCFSIDAAGVPTIGTGAAINGASLKIKPDATFNILDYASVAASLPGEIHVKPEWGQSSAPYHMYYNSGEVQPNGSYVKILDVWNTEFASAGDIDYRKGNVGIGAAPAASAILGLTSTTGALLLPRMTTTQRNALTAVNGMLIYNSTLNKFQGYENGAWASLI